MIGMSFAAALGFKFGSSFENGSIILHGAMGAVASTVTFILGSDLIQNYPHLIPAIF